MGFGIATQTGISAAIQSIPSFMSNKGLRNGYGATFAENFTDGTNTLDPRITFSRASNATVTNSSGLIQYAPHNLLTFSEQFDNAAWTKSGVSVTANNTAAPDGTTTADKIITANGSAFSASSLYQAPSKATNPLKITISVYAKAGEFNAMRLFTAGANTSTARCYADFNLATGEVISVVQGTSGFDDCTAAVTSLSNGWYRCSITFTTDSAATVRAAYYPRNTTGSTGDGTSGIYLWGSQLEIRNAVSTYNPTTVKNLLGYSEQFDNAAWTKSNSFIQTNLLLQSEAFDSASWTASSVTVVANAGVAPNGTITADNVIPTAPNASFKELQQNSSITSGVTYTYSQYVKANGYRYVQLIGGSGSFGTFNVNFDLQTGTETAFNAGTSTVVARSITAVGNGWYRISASVTALATTTGRIAVNIIPAADSPRAIGWVSDGISGVLYWGAQLVQGSVAGDYQQTTSSALAVMYQAPNGTLTADKLVENTATSAHYGLQQVTTVVGTPYTLSVYLKAGEKTRCALEIVNSAGTVSFRVNANLATGTFTTASGGSPTATAASMIDVGNGWYRLSAAMSAPTTATQFILYLQSGTVTTSYTGDGTSGIYIWGAQLSDSASLDQYVNNPVAAPSSTAYYGPRFDYDPVTLQPRGLLIEEQRVNLLLQSETFDNASWTKLQASITANAAVSPDGTQDADKVVENSANAERQIVQATSFTSGTTYAFSVYAKKSERDFLILSFGSAAFGTPTRAWFNLNTGVVGTLVNSPTASITPVGNGWYRCTIVKAATVTTSGNNIVSCSPTDNTLSYQGDGTSGIFIWGAQVEAGAFPTSYIPTVASQVTRSADAAVIQGSNFSSFYNVNEGTLYASGITSPRTTATANAENILSVSSTLNLLRGASSLSVGWFIGSATFRSLSFTTANALFKSAGGYLTGDNAAVINGGSLVTDTGNTYGTTTLLYIGASPVGANQLNGHIRQIAYYPRRLQNSQLQAITQ